MKKYSISALILLIAILVMMLTGCSCKHEIYTEADCLNLAKCLECGEVTGEALGHDYDNIITFEATCTHAGEQKYTCSRCGDTYTEATEKLAHVGEEIITIQPTFSEYGEKQLVCSVCGEVITKPIMTLGTYSDQPYETTANQLVIDVNASREDAADKYINKYLKITATIVDTTSYTNNSGGKNVGYYFVNTLASGKTRVICWFDNSSMIYDVGDTLTIIGYCEYAEEEIELMRCKVVK